MIYRFENCVLDTERRELRRAGEVIPIEPKVFEVLVYLIVHRERVVTRKELLAQCWPEVHVGDQALTQCLRRVRQVIGQTRTTPQLIRTVHGSGYRCIAEVTELSEEPDSPLEAVTRPADSEASAGATPLSDALAPEVPRRPTAERRHLTILSCGLVDIVTLVSRLDPENLPEVLQSFRTACFEVTAQFEGHVAQQSDDGFMVYFGYPQAHEDDAQRAIHTGLQLIKTLRRQADAIPDLPTPGLAVQVGIHTGLVIVESPGSTGEQPPLAMGSTPLIAAALRQLAAPHTVVISASTAALVEGYFEVKALGPEVLAGQLEPLEAYEVRGESPLQTRLEVGTTHGLTPFVGREAEVALLGERWEQVQEGLGQVVLIRGEAGIGKSRLVQVFKAQLEDVPHEMLECRCSPYHQNTALYAVLALCQHLLHWQVEDPSAVKLAKLEALLGQSSLPLPEAVPLIAGLLALEVPEDRYPLLILTPERQRERTLEVLLGLLLEQTLAQPVVLCIEDLHWADPSTVEWLGLLIAQAASTPLLVLLTCRPTFDLPWDYGTRLTPLVLTRLTRRQIEEMIAHVTGGKRFPDEVMQELVEKTDGVPLFVEELTRMILESEQLQETAGHYELKGGLRHLSIPATLHDSLMARLDRLGRGKEVAQWGAVLGRGFSSEMLAAVTPFDDAALQEGLRQLMATELLFQQGLGPQTSYRFKHALIRDAAYESMLKRHRQDMHQQIAEVLIERFPAVVETRPELVAHHYTEAACNEQAIPYWSRAGQHAAHHSAYQEAVTHLTKGLDLLPTRLATPEQIQQKLELYMSLGPVLMAIEGHATPEVEQLYRQALALCREIGDTPPQLFRVLWGLWRFYLGRAALPETRELAEQLLVLAQRQVDTGLVLQAHVALGVTLFYAGEFVSAYSHLRQVSALYDAQQHATHALLYGQVPDAYALVYTASVLWCLGYPAQAKQAADEALRRARSLAHPFTLVIVLILSGIALSLLRDHHTVYEQVEEVVRMSAKQTFPVWHAIGTQLQGWALANRGQLAKGLGQFLQGLRTHRTTEGAVTRPFLLCLLLDLYVQTRQTEAGLALIEEGLAFVTEHGTYGFHAEFYRYKGAFLLMQETPDVAQAEVCLHHALDIARRQEAKSLELRAAMSLARLWQSQNKRQDAYDLLAPVYQWFTEGFDTVDLQEAKALLVELRQL